MAYLTNDQLYKMGFKSVGDKVLISDKASFYNTENIFIGDNVRIDDFAVISGGKRLDIWDYVHIGVHTAILGQGEVTLHDFSGLSARVTIFSSTDPYDGSFMTNPTVPEKYRNTQHGIVIVGRHSVIGAGAIVLPDTCIKDNVAVGAMSLVKGGFYEDDSIYAGVPAKFVKDRRTDLLRMEDDLWER